ncbi:lytic transglycosylase domain-containing protein [Streptomyces yunnanensis]|uniref:Lytic transglycosylase domain-containing protein n=1 Tax=Streptomyces yunnanensis TaxID=156453 RepID=A0ABY8A5B6_9ACTN|nr:lytic transglycosylase domain-containing protein [Streptomyces yunnanensis]WEB40063.1 lytic transglycosylase domain-containing protein [Streptomyces yunnanensis]
MATARARWRWWVLPGAAVAVWALVHTGHGPAPDAAPRPAGTTSTAPDVTPSATPGGDPAAPRPDGAYDPADCAAAVRTYAAAAGVHPHLLMAILYNEAYKPHDPALERAWQRYKPDAAFGIANMHRAAFDEVKRGRDFADRKWEELPDDRKLAVEAAAWYLHDLDRRLPAQRPAGYSRDDLLALGYNAGAGNMLAFAHGTAPGAQARSYLDRLHANWAQAGRAVAR